MNKIISVSDIGEILAEHCKKSVPEHFAKLTKPATELREDGTLGYMKPIQVPYSTMRWLHACPHCASKEEPNLEREE